LLSVEMDEPKVSRLSFLQEIANTDNAKNRMRSLFFMM
jgi:hypothetical protein